ncbi:MAG: GTP 3',8-cyclase MoaA [Deltaproteobacteria bacterium]|nr:GTP 3',8-cyclase MoaA [Deltaproteobacteria bacterium]
MRSAESLPGLPLLDTFARKHDYLRISITDRCNLRCQYCMPEEMVWMERADILSFEEILRFTRVAVSVGVTKARITGGEPLLRKDVVSLVERLAAIEGIEDLSLTTNGVLLRKLAEPLYKAGLRRVNISLDSLRPDRYHELTRRDQLPQVLDGIEAAADAGFSPIKINAVMMKDVNVDEAIEFALLSRTRPFHVRFLEYMPLDGQELWKHEDVVTGAQILARIRETGDVVAVESDDLSEVARRWRFEDGEGEIGFINPVSEPFCGACSRIRLTADGMIKNCLLGNDEFNVKRLMRTGGDDEEIASLIRLAVQMKAEHHGINRPGFEKLVRNMSRVGG